MDVLERVVDADARVVEPTGITRIVTELRAVARDLRDPLDDAADAIEFLPRTQVHRMITRSEDGRAVEGNVGFEARSPS